MTDQALSRTFLDVGESYERYRPGYPSAIAAAVVPRPVGHALDLGAGTGKFTEQLMTRARRVSAVDPSARMLAELRRKAPAVDALVGSAERIPLADASCDVVTVAQAFHWFEAEAACAEIARVLVPGGRLALVWNGTDPDCRWDAACYRLVHSTTEAEVGAHARRPKALELPGFTFESSVRVWWHEELTREDYLRRWGTVSVLLAADPAARIAMNERIEAVLDADPESTGRELLSLAHATDALLYRVGAG